MRDIPQSCVLSPAMGSSTVMLLGHRFFCDDDTRGGGSMWESTGYSQTVGQSSLRGIVRRARESLARSRTERFVGRIEGVKKSNISVMVIS
jgi:hypothetical protein